MNELAQFFPDGLPSGWAWLAKAMWLLQLGLIVHVYKTGRPYWWIWLLFMAPLIGGLAYVLVELAPSFRSPRGFWYSLKPRRWRISDLRRDLEESETVDRRLRLATELAAAGELRTAHDTAADCLAGVFKDDPHTLFAVATYKVKLGMHEEAWGLIERIDTKRDRMLEIKVAVLRGDCLAGLNRFAEAEQAYHSVAGRFSGEAPRAGLALVYERTGRPSEATALWNDIRVRYRKANPAWRRSERAWYKLARARLDAGKRPAASPVAEPARR